MRGSSGGVAVEDAACVVAVVGVLCSIAAVAFAMGGLILSLSLSLSLSPRVIVTVRSAVWGQP